MPNTKAGTQPDVIKEAEALLNDVGFSGDFEDASRPLLRRLVEEVKRLHELLSITAPRCVRCGNDFGRLCNKCAREPSSVF